MWYGERDRFVTPAARNDFALWRRSLVGYAAALALGIATMAGTHAWNAWAAYAGYLRYEPREGDVIFQSLPHGPVVWGRAVLRWRR
jgi:hypothetical protein